MAVKWAVANGQWSAGATWNDGTVPQEGDYVYANGHNVTCDSSVNIGNGTLTNELNPNTNISGGTFTFSGANITIIANLEGANTYVAVLSGTGITNILINGNITSSYGINSPANNIGNNATLTFNGNVKGIFFRDGSSQNYTRTLTINGVVARGSQLLIGNSSNHRITINGIYFASVDFESVIARILYFEVIGKMYICDNYIVPYAIRINGEIDTTLSNVEFFPSTSSIVFLGQSIITTKSADYPHPEDVRKNITYDFGQKVGTMEQTIAVGCVTKEDVREGVELIGLQEVGTLVVPSVDDVREGVVFDNGSVGTLIVQGGGDRLRIADFGYYTNAQSDTYIVDLTEQDKPKFAVAEERVLIEMFPELDLDNIPEKYFDDLFVKYLKYRLIVEYYRTAGINSTFTPSEPTTEIVNYQNVRNEVWLNSANIYLKAWGKKFPESIMKPQRILL